LENVDPILVEHIKISIETFNERHSVFSEIEQEISKIEAGSQRIINYCRAYGKVEDTEQKRASLLVASSPLILRRRNLTKLKERRADLVNKYAGRMRNTAQLDKPVAARLREKHYVEFIDRY
jgi:hypothetical protein